MMKRGNVMVGCIARVLKDTGGGYNNHPSYEGLIQRSKSLDDFLKEIKSGEVMVEILSIEYSYTVDKLLALCKRKDNGEYLSLPLYDITLVSLKPTEINRAEFPKEITSNKTLESENPTEKALYLMNIFIILGFLSLACYVFYKNNNPNDMGDHGDYEVRCVEGYKYKTSKDSNNTELLINEDYTPMRCK